MSDKITNAKMNLDEAITLSRRFISELLQESTEPTEARESVASAVAQAEATLAVARSIEYLTEVLRDSSAPRPE